MRKSISTILAFAILFSSFIIGIENPLIAKAEENNIHSFINETVELIKENDADKVFVAENEEEIETASYALSVDETEDTTFQTCRLIVKSDTTPDKLNSIGIASGFQNYHIVQFATSEDAEKAYNVYLADKNVISVTPDMVFKATCDVTVTEETTNDESKPPDRLNSWGGEVTGLYAAKDYIEDNYSNLDEVIVGVVDSGIYLEHEFFKNRIIRTYFNVASDGEKNNENDVLNGIGHGTNVSSIIVDNTPENVKIKNYRFIDQNNNATPATAACALLKAIEDKVDIINASFQAPDESGLVQEALNMAHESNILVIAAAGNGNLYVELSLNNLPASDEKVITVSALGQFGIPTSFTSYSHVVDVAAPGENIYVADSINKYGFADGTSFSAPFVTSLAALLKSLNPEITNKEIEVKMESTAVPSDMNAESDLFGYGTLDAIAACELNRCNEPEINYASGKYTGEISIEISTEDNSEVYFTVDGSYPTPTNGTLFTDTIKLSNDMLFFKAVAYSNSLPQSTCAKRFYRLQTMGTADMFTINEDGQITSYIGENIYDLIIPEVIGDIKVTGIAHKAFSNAELIGVTMPENLKEIPAGIFMGNPYIMYADGDSITEIGNGAFNGCYNLYVADFPNAIKIGDNAFYGNQQLSEAYFPYCVSIGTKSFLGCFSLRRAYFPELISAGYDCFKNCLMMSDVCVTALKDFSLLATMFGGQFSSCELYKGIDLPEAQNISRAFFYNPVTTPSAQMYTYTSKVEFSKVKEIRSLPLGYCKNGFGSVKLVLPSTLELCDPDYFDDVQPDWYIVYGTKGTYAEQWANEKGFEFVEIAPETAVINDLPDEYYSYMRPLEADVVGFNKTYQWYGANSPRYDKGIAITNATERKFNPNEHKLYKYYFCKVISTDVGCDPIEITTGICENKSYTYTPPTSNGKVTIATPSNRYLKYGESINLYANSTGLPEDAKIKWRIVEGSGVTLDASVTGRICTVTSKSNGNVIIEAYAVNKNGNSIVNEKGNRICDREGVSSEVSLWWIILYYIRQMFSISNIMLEQSFL